MTNSTILKVLAFLNILFLANLSFGQVSISGTVRSVHDSLPVIGATTGVDEYHQMIYEADSFGNFSYPADTGNQRFFFSQPGYDSVIIDTTIGNQGVIGLNIYLHRHLFPPRNVLAIPSSDGQMCLVSWDHPKIEDEFSADGGYYNNYKKWNDSRGVAAVKFTPLDYPVVVTGISLNVGDGSYPEGASWIGSRISVMIIDDDGPGGFPGTELIKKEVRVTRYGSVDFKDVFNVEITDGSFYLGIDQISSWFTSNPPLAIDTLGPFYNNSYYKPQYYNNYWENDTVSDYSIRAIYHFYPDNTSYYYNSDYLFSSVESIDPCFYPEQSTTTPLFDIDTNEINIQLAPFFITPYYGFAIRTQNDFSSSGFTFSNIIPPDGSITADFNIDLCDSVSPVLYQITMRGTQCGFSDYLFQSDSFGIASIDTLISDYYGIEIRSTGYEVIHLDSVFVEDDTTFVFTLDELKYPPLNFSVDTSTNTASWDFPLISPLFLETFEDTTFPPIGWQESFYPAGHGWFRTDQHNYSDFAVPPGDGYYAMSHAGYGSGPTHPMDYLITPMIDLRECEDYNLIYDSYFTGAYGQDATLEFSYDNGDNWEVFHIVEPEGQWVKKIVDIGEFAGDSAEYIWFAFHSDDNNSSASGWAIDNVIITGDSATPLGYNLTLNGLMNIQLPPDVFSYQFEDLNYGQNYFACINALYNCGGSDYVCYEWQSGHLYKPLNFHNDYLTTNYDMNIFWTPPVVLNTDSVPKGLDHFLIYLNDSVIDSLAYFDQCATDTISYYFDSLDPATYFLNVSAKYNLESYGFPGEFAESKPTETDTVMVVWGNSIPFFEDWNSESFSFNYWHLSDVTGNWRINNDKGNPAPVAEFYWLPQIDQAYNLSLTSNFIRADSIVEGSLMLEFDIRLHDRNQTETEKLTVEISDGEQWILLEEFLNNGTYNYNSLQYDISDIVEAKIFRIRFTASGMRTLDLFGWYIDNIHIYRDCTSPDKLEAVVDFFTFNDPAIKLKWEGPVDPGPIKELHWDDDTFGEGIGYTEGGTLSVAARWEPEQLSEFEGAELKKIRFFVNDGFSNIIARIWKGSQAGELLYEKDVTSTTIPGSWNEIILETSIYLDATEELWVGYEITHNAGFLPIATDEGPAVRYFGDMINTGSHWESLASNYGLNYNIKIRCVLENDFKFLKHNTGTEYRISVNPRFVQGYNICRMSENDIDYELYDYVEYVYGQSEYIYYDTMPNVDLNHGYYYQVTSIWQSSIDACESTPALSKLNPQEDFVYVFLENVKNVNLEEYIKVYPNPSSEIIQINSLSPIKSVRILNLKGQTIICDFYNWKKSVVLETNFLTQGVYLVIVDTENGACAKRLVIAR